MRRPMNAVQIRRSARAAVRAPIRVVERDVGVGERELLAHMREMGVEFFWKSGSKPSEFEAIGPAPPGA
jgi:hypothetical protein